MKTKEYWIKHLGLQEHPEGGYFKETYRSTKEIEVGNLNVGFSGKRNLCTGIYFLIDSANFSSFHRIKSDEMWHYYAGDPLIVHMIDLNGNYLTQKIGANIGKGEQLQYVVPANYWFASEVADGGEYSLVGCTVSFGFDFDDFELADNSLLEKYPNHYKRIKRLLRI